MDQDLVKRRHRELSKQQAIYVAARERGKNREQSAVLAGYPAGQEAGKQVEKSLVVQEELAKARAEMAAAAGVTREDIIGGLLEAYNTAKTMADPGAMVRAMAELGKMLGLYAPEVKKHLHELDPSDREAIKRLSDSDLHKLAKGRIVDVEDAVLVKTKELPGGG